MLGKNVKCPRCQSPFVFAPTKSTDSNRAITDTGVMRILGDMPRSTPPAQPKPTDSRGVTDTGVMRILGDVAESKPARTPTAEAAIRPCTRCGIKIQESLAVCPHCNCYVGVMPKFMQEMTDGRKTSSN